MIEIKSEVSLRTAPRLFRCWRVGNFPKGSLTQVVLVLGVSSHALVSLVGRESVSLCYEWEY